jgi:hypothetical protein
VMPIAAGSAALARIVHEAVRPRRGGAAELSA